MLRTYHTAAATRAFLFSLLMAVAAAAGPRIEIAQRSYDFGNIAEGSRKEIVHSFKVRNAGNENLRITDIRAGCGCTVVEYDTLIAPGKSGTVTQKVKLKGFKGKIKKDVTIISNAENESTVRLYLEATILAEIESSAHFMRLKTARPDSGYIAPLITSATNLEIKRVQFIAETGPGGSGPKLNEPPVDIAFNLKAPYKDPRTQRNIYELIVHPPATATQTRHGKLSIATNLEHASTVEIRAMLDTSSK